MKEGIWRNFAYICMPFFWILEKIYHHRVTPAVFFRNARSFWLDVCNTPLTSILYNIAQNSDLTIRSGLYFLYFWRKLLGWLAVVNGYQKNTGCSKMSIFLRIYNIYPTQPGQRWEFIKEDKKTRTPPRKRSRKKERQQELHQESDQENKKKKQENKNSTKKTRKKNFLFFLITFLVEFLFSCFLTVLFSFINSHFR